MKQLFAFSILFCLVFLNVPRSFVHNCEHESHLSDMVDHEHGSDDGSVVIDVDQDNCFICEFDLDVYECPEIKISSFSFFCDYSFKENTLNYSEPNEFFAFSHRGPPTV